MFVQLCVIQLVVCSTIFIVLSSLFSSNSNRIQRAITNGGLTSWLKRRHAVSESILRQFELSDRAIALLKDSVGKQKNPLSKSLSLISTFMTPMTKTTTIVPARMPPIDILHTPHPEANHMHAAVQPTYPKADILGFCTAGNQRAGQAGRVALGRGFQLYTKWAYMKELAEDKVTEIQKTILVSVPLLLTLLGINDLIGIDCFDPPPGCTLIWSIDLLYALEAHSNRGELNKNGRKMAAFPMDPMLSKAIVEMEKHQ
ncbi:hypothetical protein O181_112647 [Austropuccinia psidii MF-1]|uniref:Uncharacterized protein n=1 Tax=Austropuccinia psidii MF-1 TaxID=1389203 RepID=A0A9Q3PUK2_9BASI|nr:hypothetical protein [Austropuccinia psidii MF-1]